MFPSWSWVMGLVIGAAVGSFLNMLIYRLPRRLSFSNPPKSFCPKCKHSLAVVDLIPLLSWLSTGGKCRYCKEPIAVRYFLVELLMGSLYAGLWWVYMIQDPMGQPMLMALYMAAVAALVSIIFIDWELYIIPDEINGFLLLVGIGVAFVQRDFMTSLWGAIAGWGILWGIAFLGRIMFGKDSMGHGDIKMMRGVGAIIGPVLMLANMGIAVIAGLVIGIAVIVATRNQQAEAEGEEEVVLPPETIGSLLKFGVFYLLCLDLVGIFWHGIYGVIGEKYVEENIEDDAWKPSLTTIPFGPYLAIGALACMLFATPITTMMQNYWKHATNAEAANSPKQNFLFADVGRQSRLTTSGRFGVPCQLSGTRSGEHSNLLMTWNKIEGTSVQHHGENGAQCA